MMIILAILIIQLFIVYSTVQGVWGFFSASSSGFDPFFGVFILIRELVAYSFIAHSHTPKTMNHATNKLSNPVFSFVQKYTLAILVIEICNLKYKSWKWTLKTYFGFFWKKLLIILNCVIHGHRENPGVPYYWWRRFFYIKSQKVKKNIFFTEKRFIWHITRIQQTYGQEMENYIFIHLKSASSFWFRRHLLHLTHLKLQTPCPWRSISLHGHQSSPSIFHSQSNVI